MQKENKILYLSIYCSKLNKGVKIPFAEVSISQSTRETDIDSFTKTEFSFMCKCGDWHDIVTGES